RPKAAERRLSVGPAFGQINRLRARLDFVIVALAYFLQNISHLMHPTALMRHSGINGGNRRRQSGTAIGDDQAQLLAFEPAPIQIAEQAFPVGLALALAAHKS